MENNLHGQHEEVIFGSSDKKISKRISRLEKSGKIKKIAPRIYTTNLDEKPEIIIGRNLFTILGSLYSGAQVSHRSALEFQPTASGHFFLTYTYTRKISLPGLTLRFLQGHPPIENDNLLSEGLFVSQQARAFLENYQVSRQKGPISKTLSKAELEERLEQIIKVQGEEGLNELRDRARTISKELGMEAEFNKLNKTISALLSTHSSSDLSSEAGKARSLGIPYDIERVELFTKLFRTLKQCTFQPIEEQNQSYQAYRNFAFFESYFSNYIEGTRFGVEEAKQIIETAMPLPTRDEDSHDVLGTFKLVSNKKEMTIIPQTPEELIELLCRRHAILLSARKSKNPGRFKSQNNYAGQTAFVDATLVRGTLIKAFELYRALDAPFALAAYMMFVISEIHPFMDGNGRIARVMMNAELTKANQVKIIIPTVYRDDYILALRKLTRKGEPDAFIRMLSRAHTFSATITGQDMAAMHGILKASNAFLEPEEGILKIN